MLTLNLCKNDVGRDMILYIDSCVKYSPIHIDIDFQEYICVEFSLKNKDKLLLASIYRSPSSDDVNNGNLNIFLKKLCNMSYSHLLLFGDMNFSHIDWNNISTDKGAGDCN
jgi:hypothetical protein